MRLGYHNPPPSHSCHLGQTDVRVIKVVQPIMNSDEIHRLVSKGQVLHISDDRLDPQAVPVRTGLRPQCRAEREVRTCDDRSCASEELGVHTRPAADSQRGRTKEMWADGTRGATELLPEQETVQTRRPVGPGDLECLLPWAVEMGGLSRLVPGPVMVIELIVLGQRRIGQQDRHP